MFKIMGNKEIFDTAVEGLGRVKEALTNMPEGTLQLTQAMTSVSNAAAAAANNAELITIIKQLSTGGVGGAGSSTSVHGTMDVKFDHDMFKNEVVDIVSKQIKAHHLSQHRN